MPAQGQTRFPWVGSPQRFSTASSDPTSCHCYSCWGHRTSPKGSTCCPSAPPRHVLLSAPTPCSLCLFPTNIPDFKIQLIRCKLSSAVSLECFTPSELQPWKSSQAEGQGFVAGAGEKEGSRAPPGAEAQNTLASAPPRRALAVSVGGTPRFGAELQRQGQGPGCAAGLSPPQPSDQGRGCGAFCWQDHSLSSSLISR